MSDPIFSFVHVTDTHHMAGDDRLERFVDTINTEKYFPRPDYVIHTGDIINGYEETPELHWEALAGAKEILIRLKSKLMLTCHNHDTYGEDIRGTIYDEIFGLPHFQSIEREGFLLTAFSGAMGTDHFWESWPTDKLRPGRAGDCIQLKDMLEVLPEYLDQNSDLISLVFSHRGVPVRKPAIDIPEDHLQAYEYIRSVPIIDTFKKVMNGHGNNAAHYSGHTHVNAHQQFDGISYITTASMIHYPRCFRYVKVFEDRLENQMFFLEGEPAGPFRWGPLTDADHSTSELYYGGQPEEREFEIKLT